MTDIIIHDMTIDEFAEYDHEDIGYLIGTGRVDVMDEQPTIDAVSVVRCKDCKWFRHEIEFGLILIGNCPYQPPYEHTWYSCAVFHRETLLDDYCSKGERREDNGKTV